MTCQYFRGLYWTKQRILAASKTNLFFTESPKTLGVGVPSCVTALLTDVSFKLTWDKKNFCLAWISKNTFIRYF
jgi:hypothetical protein